jgi:predicted DNA-binding protein (MmcQ/YjbR family)
VGDARIDADPEVQAFDRVRAICHSFGDVERAELQGRPLFRVGRRRFAIFNSDYAPRRPRWAGQGCSLHFLADPAEAEALRADHRFSPSPHHGDRDWFALRLDTGDVDWDEVAELLDSAHAQVSTSRRQVHGSS